MGFSIAHSLITLIVFALIVIAVIAFIKWWRRN